MGDDGRRMTFLNRFFALIVALTGIALCWFGGRLILVGGSAYYLPAGIVLVVTAALIWRRSTKALPLFGMFMLATLLWSLWEAGLNGWALVARLGMFAAFGLWMLTPWFRGWIGRRRTTPLTRGIFAVVILAALAGAGWTFWNDRSLGGSGAPSAPGEIVRAGWPHYGRTAGGSRHSPLTQIDAQNVGGLKRAWIFHLGLEPTGFPSSFAATPLEIGGRLYFCTGYNDVIALDGETGRQLWRFAAHANAEGVFGQNCRGISYFKRADAAAGTPCAERLYTATIDARLIAIDVANGRRCADFGRNGEVNLLEGMSKAPKGYYHITSPPAVVRGKIILGGWVTDGQRTREPSGAIRAFDAVTGQLAWAWDIGRPDRIGAPAPGETYTPGTPNSWGVMSSDEALGLIYVPTGNATPDFYGGHRTAAMDQYASSVIALDVENGRPRWSFQTAHHDLWDYDVASQPVLVDLADGTPALLQPTKRGELFVLDRRTGKPLREVIERPVPAGNAQGERYAPTQPFSIGMPSFAGPRPSERRMWGLTPIDQAWCRVEYARARFEGSMTPVGSDRPTVEWPGSLGGMNWGSVAVDPVRQIVFVNSSAIMNYLQLMPRAEAVRRGIRAGDHATLETVARTVPQDGTPYATIIGPFLSPLGVPCQEPPYGLVGAVDLKTGRLLWRKPFGTARDSGPMGLHLGLPIPMGVPNIGGAVVTASGLAFIGATQEHRIRAFDITTGRELWKDSLPAGGNASPMTFWSPTSRRQFVVIAVGGHGGIMSGHSDTLIAYALPSR
jgi:quinoprotein glucose dehydrogenase